MERMYDRRKQRFVYVYSIDNVRKSAMVYDPVIARKNIGHGWQETKLCALIPSDLLDSLIEQISQEVKSV